MTEKTHSQILFEKFCIDNSIQCLPIPISYKNSQKTPDYKLSCNTHEIIVEVKELGLSPGDKDRYKRLETSEIIEAFDPKLDERVRKMIDDAMPQLRQFAKGKHPAIVVLYSGASIIPIEGVEIRQAMYGQDVVDIGLVHLGTDSIPYSNHHFGRGQKVSRSHNTTLSAVALLDTKSEGTLKLSIYHNKYAAIPIDPSWITNPNVLHFQIGDHIQRGGLKDWEAI